MTLGWSPPLLMTRWLRWEGSRCSLSLSQPMSISTAASSASRAFHGEVAAWALSPLKVNSAEMSAYWRRPYTVPRLEPIWSCSATSTSLK